MRIFLTVLLALGFSSAAQAQNEDLRVAEFRSVCIAPTTFDGYAEAALARGWTSVDASQSRLATMVQLGQRSMEGAEFQTFSRDANGVQLDLMISRIRIPQGLIQGCGLFHAGASDAIAPTQFASAWLSGAPTSNEQHGATVHVWNQPRTLPGVFVVKLGHVSSGSPVAQAAGFDGVTMSVDRVER